MVLPALLRRFVVHRTTLSSAARGGDSLHFSVFNELKSTLALSNATETVSQEKSEKKGSNRWFTLPPYTATVNGAVLGNHIVNQWSQAEGEPSTTAITALKWVLRCCPELPRNLVQKLFRLRKVRRGSSSMIGSSECNLEDHERRLKRVAAKDMLNIGDQIFLPSSVQILPTEKARDCCNEEEEKFIHSLVLYKDPAIIVINKPPGLPVQGGIGIKRSLDELAASCLNYDYSEPPRLVHRLDRDSSGILVMGRTSISTSALHSIFREKTFGASKHHVDGEKRILQKRYWALVIGSPRRPKGLMTAPLGKIVMDDGRSEKIMVIDNAESIPFQHAITTYRVIKSYHGYTWLELCPLTGRKHQLRVHCAEVLGTPIVGDYKYGWQAHRKWKPYPSDFHQNQGKKQSLPFGLDFENGSIAENNPRLHLHCKQLTIPDVSRALHNDSLDHDCAGLECLELDAPLPSYMQRSWDIIKS